MQKLKNLEDLRVLCEDQQVEEGIALSWAVEFTTQETGSSLGFVSVVDLEDNRFLHPQERYVVNTVPREWRYNRIFLPIGAEELPRNERSLSGLVAHTRKSYRCGDAINNEYYMSIDDDVLSELVVPITHEEELLGVINLESYILHYYTDEDEKLLCRVATYIAKPLARLRVQEKYEYIERLAATDFATLYRQHYSTSQDLLHAVLQQISNRMEILKSISRIRDGKQLIFWAYYPEGIQPFHWSLHSQEPFMQQIGASELQKEDRSFAGYIGHTKQPQRVGDMREYPYFEAHDGKERSALGMPILFDDNILGVITLFHHQVDYYTTTHERYLCSFMRYIAIPLHDLLTRETHHTPLVTIHRPIKSVLKNLEIDDPLATVNATNAVSEHVAKDLNSKLCTIWLVNSMGELVLHGKFGFSSSSIMQEQEEYEKVSQAIQDAFGVHLDILCQGLEARRETAGWRALSEQKMQNLGPNRDPTFLQKGYVQPFIIMPILSYGNHAIGVIHVTLKGITPYNRHGFYSEGDERLLESLQMEIVDLYEQQRCRTTAEYAVQDLHDALSLVTYDLLYRIDLAQNELERQDIFRAVAVLQDIERTGQSLVREIRSIMVGMKSQVLENMGLIEALRHFINTSVIRPGLKVDFVSEEISAWLPIKLAWQLYRIAQEALTNVIKHAKADCITCRVEIGVSEIILYIHDNGQGFDVTDRRVKKYGLTNMLKRTEAGGGTFELRSRPGEGTTITVKVPRGAWYATTSD